MTKFKLIQIQSAYRLENKCSSNFEFCFRNKLNVTQKLKLVTERVENILEKGENAENAGYQHFLLFPKYFQRASSSRVVKSPDCVVKR